MSDLFLVPRLPEREALIRFFVERPDLSVKEAANLLGWQRPALLQQARSEGALLPDGRVEWHEVAFWLLQAWPRAWLLQKLGAYARLIPPELHLADVRWRLPLYMVRALERQADALSVPVEDYVADALHLAIDDDTLATFRNDAAFREAYDYPSHANDDEAKESG